MKLNAREGVLLVSPACRDMQKRVSIDSGVAFLECYELRKVLKNKTGATRLSEDISQHSFLPGVKLSRLQLSLCAWPSCYLCKGELLVKLERRE